MNIETRLMGPCQRRGYPTIGWVSWILRNISDIFCVPWKIFGTFICRQEFGLKHPKYFGWESVWAGVSELPSYKYFSKTRLIRYSCRPLVPLGNFCLNINTVDFLYPFLLMTLNTWIKNGVENVNKHYKNILICGVVQEKDQFKL